MISTATKRSVTAIVPVVLATTAGIISYRQKASWKVIGIVVAVAYVLTFILSKQGLKLVGEITDRPPKITVDPSVGGQLPTGFDGEIWAQRLRNDVYCIVCTRDTGLYNSLVAMNDSQLVAVANAFNKLYYNEHRETIVAAMEAEWYGNGWFNDVPKQAANIISRLKNMNFI